MTVSFGYSPTTGGKMERSRLRRYAGMRYADLDPILRELAQEGRIRISGECNIVSLK